MARELAADVCSLVGANLAQLESQRQAERELGGPWPALFEEVHHHARCALRNGDIFFGMTASLQQLRAWLCDPRMQQLVSVHGAAGSGKTALLSKVCLLAEAWLGSDCVLVARFMGTSPQSSSLVALLASVCQQLSRAYSISLNPDKLQNLKSLTAYFPRLLRAVSQKGGRSRPLLIVLDALEGLIEVGEPQKLLWVPGKLPAYVNIILSTQLPPEAVREAVGDPGGFASQLHVEALDPEAVQAMCKDYLASKGRRLQEQQLQVLTQQVRADMSPQHLRLLLDAASRWASFHEVAASDVPPSIRETITAFLAGLQQLHGRELVRAALSYFSLGFHGITDVELGDLLSCNDAVLNEVFRFHDPPVHGWIRTPAAVLVRLLDDLKDHIAAASVHGRELLTWRHEAFRELSLELFLPSATERRDLHLEMARLHLAEGPIRRTVRLANVKRSTTIPDADRLIAVTALTEANPRKLLCIWFHLASAGQAELLKEAAVCNLAFLRAYIAAFGLQGTIQMIAACLSLLRQAGSATQEMQAVRDCLVFSADILERDRKALPVQLLGQLRGLRHEDGAPMRCVAELCRQCAAAEDKNIFFTLVPTSACFLSSQGALKLYRENVLSVFDVSDNGMYLLLYTASARNTKHLKLLDLDTLEMSVTMDLPDEPVDCRMNRAVALVYVLTKDHLLLFDLTDGQKRCEYSTLIAAKFRLSSCFDFTEEGTEVALGGEDRVAILCNRGHKQGPEKLSFEWDRSLVVRTACKTAAVLFVNSERLSLLVSVHVSRLENELLFRVFNHESKEVLTSLELGVLPSQIGLPCSGRHLLLAGSTRVLLALNDGALFLIDILSATIVWRHHEAVNPGYLRTVRPHLRFALPDRARGQVLLATSYGEFTWLRQFDLAQGRFVFAQRSSRDRQPVTAACLFGPEDDPKGRTLALGGRAGHLEVVRRGEEAEAEAEPFSERPGRTCGFRGHLRAVRFVLHRAGRLVSLGEDRLLKVWRLAQVPTDPALQAREDNATLQHENVASVALTIDGRFVVTASRLIKVWRLDSGALERSIAPHRGHARVTDPSALSLVDNDRFLLFESKQLKALAVADFASGSCLRTVPKPSVWQPSATRAQLFAVTMREDGNFLFQLLRLPTFEPLLRKEFCAPHPGIEEAVRGLSLSKLEDTVVLHWGHKSAASFEAWALDLSDLSQPLALVGCQESGAAKNARAWKQAAEFKRAFCLLPLTSTSFVLGAHGDLPVWDLRSNECAVPFTPYMEAWLKHSVSVNLCRPDLRPKNRKGYDEKQFPKSPITAIAVSMDAGLVVSGAEDGSIIMWRHNEVGRVFEYDIARSWGSRVILKAHEAEVTCLELSAKEDLLLSGSEDKSLCLFSVGSGRLLHRVFTHMSARSATLSPDSRFAIVECRNLAERRLMVFELSGSRSQ